MSAAIVRLDELADPTAFLAGARVPLTHLWPAQFRVVEWVVDRILIDAQSGPRFDFIRPETVIMLGLDCSDPDVARWCDRQIGKTLGFVNPDHGVLGCTNKWCFWWVGDECPWFLADWRPELNRALSAIPCADANIPLARAAILRALFSVSNA